MRIDNVKINGFGKIKNKSIDFCDGINIVYGENESGKSTVLKAITACLYGASKNKNGKNISDFDKYKPWDDGEFSGKLEYTLENGEKYEVFREFKKKNPVIYNNLKEDISKQFVADKSKGINFFEQQVGIDEELFANTAIIGQQEVKLGKSETNLVVQKISNLVSSGDDNISFKKSIDKLNKMQNEAVGTDKTRQKPINVVDSNIKMLQEQKRNLSVYKENAKSNLLKKQQLEEKMEVEQNKKSLLKEVKEYTDLAKIKNVGLEFEKNLEKEYEQKVVEIKQKIELEKNSGDAPKQSKMYKYLLIFFIVLFIILSVVVKKVIVSMGALLPIVATAIFMVVKSKQQISQIKKSNQDLSNEYDIALENYKKKKREVEEKEKALQNENHQELKNICDKYKENVGLAYAEKVANMSAPQIENELEYVQNTINDMSLQVRILENEKQNVDENLEELARVQEKLEKQNEIRKELVSLSTSFDIAKEALTKAYEEVKHNISPRFQQNLCEIIGSITENKYNNITLNDETGLNVEVENGSYMPVDRLSVGTIDEMYLSLRLSTLSEISQEPLPIILDEAFAYFDDERLKNILCYLQDKKYNHQIIIFTCSNREEQALNQLKIEYNLISLEK